MISMKRQNGDSPAFVGMVKFWTLWFIWFVLSPEGVNHQYDWLVEFDMLLFFKKQH